MEKLFIDNDRLNTLANIAANKIATIVNVKDFDATIKLYGVPRGGIPALFAVCNAFNRLYSRGLSCQAVTIDNVKDADFIIDDIIDSGRTRAKYIFETHLTKDNILENRFVALIDKTTDKHYTGKWVVFPWEVSDTREISAEDIPTRFLQVIGEDINRQGLQETPSRVVKSWTHLYSGYTVDIPRLFKNFDNPDCDEMVILRDIEFYSTCEHHVLPFFGKCHIGYIPDRKVIGVSKLARVVDAFSRRLQIQEKLTKQIAGAIMENLHPLGVGVIMEAKHMCMLSRGVQKQNSIMQTSALLGVFRQPETRSEFLNLCRGVV